jgi:hypothetical protein
MTMDSVEQATQYCPGTKFFINNIIGLSPQAEMTVVGVDRGHYLHIGLYLKLPGRSEIICLNDTLFEKKFAGFTKCCCHSLQGFWFILAFRRKSNGHLPVRVPNFPPAQRVEVPLYCEN